MCRRPEQKGARRQALGRSRAGFTTKIHTKSDASEDSAFDLTGGEASDGRNFETLLDIIAKRDPYGRMVAGVLSSSYVTIDASVLQTLHQNGTEQKVVNAETPAAFPALPHVIPERVHRFFGMERADGVGPALREKAQIRGAALGLQQGVTIPGLRRVDVEVCRHNVVIASQRDGRAGRVKFSRMGGQGRPGHLAR